MKTKTIKNPWENEFVSTKYDDRNKQAAGDYYGVGIRQPVGSIRQDTGPIPRMNKQEIGKPPLKNG